MLYYGKPRSILSAICDGFTGNVVLKLTEGLGKWFAGELKGIFMENTASKVGYLCVRQGVERFRRSMDYKEYGGAPLMGTVKPVIKAHGSSDVIGQIESALEKLKKEAK